MLEISSLSASYGPIAALAEVTMSVGRGEIVSLLGSNGAGKSTLLGCVTQSVTCRMSGSIRLEGAELLGLPTDAIIARGLVLVPAGRFRMGSNDGKDNAKPGHWEDVKTFYMDQTEVTMDQYRGCVKAGGCSSTSARITSISFSGLPG
jgi:branched-chain amino acid transport system ATP-binding protein